MYTQSLRKIERKEKMKIEEIISRKQQEIWNSYTTPEELPEAYWRGLVYAEQARNSFKLLDKLYELYGRSNIQGQPISGTTQIDGNPAVVTDAPLLDGYIQYKDVAKNPYDEIYANKKLSQEEKLHQVKNVIQETEKEMSRRHRIENAKMIGGAALQAGSSFIPGLAPIKGASAITKAITPVVTKIFITHLITQSRT